MHTNVCYTAVTGSVNCRFNCKLLQNIREPEEQTMAKIGSMELIVILIVAFLAIGPERMPKVARKFGRMLRSFRKMMNDASDEFRD